MTRNERIKLRWTNGATQEEIAEEFGLTKQRVSQIIHSRHKGDGELLSISEVSRRIGCSWQKAAELAESSLDVRTIGNSRMVLAASLENYLKPIR